MMVGLPVQDLSPAAGGEGKMPEPLVSPVSEVAGEPARAVESGIALCLSGGGYRAMLFHLGSVWRMLELGLFDPVDHTAHLPGGGSPAVGRLQRVSSVSGGSIISAVLGMHWTQIAPGTAGALQRFQALVVAPIRAMAGTTLAGPDFAGALNVIRDVLLPGSVNDHVAQAYAKHLYRDATLKDLPDEPRFVINASNLQSGALWRFMKPYVRDWRVGEMVQTQKVTLAKAVAASSAFPPVLAPATFTFAESDYTPNSGGKGANNLQHPPYTTGPILADGGVYDNLGLETAYKRYKTLFVSNAGAPFEFEPSVHDDWVRLGIRVIALVDNQVGALRKRLLVNSLVQGDRLGAFWDIDQAISVHHCPNALPCDIGRTRELAHLGTDLSKKEPALQERLINWGYAIADAAIRAHFDVQAKAPGAFPYPGGV